MNTTALVILVIIAAVALAVGAVVYLRRCRTKNLRRQFGPEYKRALDRYGDQRKAETELAAREIVMNERQIALVPPPNWRKIWTVPKSAADPATRPRRYSPKRKRTTSARGGWGLQRYRAFFDRLLNV